MLDTLQEHIINQGTKSTWEYIKDYLPILTLILGALLGYWIDKLKTRSTFKLTRRYFFYTLFHLNKGVKEQIKLYQKQIELVNSESTNIPSMPINMNFTTSLVNTVSYNDLYKMLVLKGIKKDKYYITDLKILKVGFDKIDAIINSNEKNYENLFKSNKRSTEKFNKLLPRLHEELDKILDGTDINYKNMRRDINKLGTDFQNARSPKEEATIFKTMNNFVLPIKEILENNNYIDPKLTPIISELEYTFHRFKDARDSFCNHLKMDLDDLQFINTHQNLLLEKYNKYVDKDLFEVEEWIKKQIDLKETL